MKNTNFANINSNKKIAIAVSGGIDSTALMFLVRDFAEQNGIEIISLTVDHKLRKSSTRDAKFVSKLAKKYNIEHYVLTWDGEKSGSNVEFEARQARYDLLTTFCKENGIDCLLIGHHKQDQAENFLIRLFRGSGIDGLASMKEEREINGVKIIRPLLNVSKEELRDYLKKRKIKWVEDESNKDEKFLRNKIRKFLNSFSDKEDIINRINESVSTIAKARDVIEMELLEKSKKIVKYYDVGYMELKAVPFKVLGEDMGLRLLAWAVMEMSGNPYKPRFEKLKKLYDVILFDKKFSQTFYGCEIESDGKNIVIYREKSAINNQIKQVTNSCVLWDERFEFKVKPNKLFAAQDIEITDLNAQELKKLSKTLKKLQNIKGTQKKILLTTPIIKLKNTDDFYAVGLNYSSNQALQKNIKITRKFYTPLQKKLK